MDLLVIHTSRSRVNGVYCILVPCLCLCLTARAMISRTTISIMFCKKPKTAFVSYSSDITLRNQPHIAAEYQAQSFSPKAKTVLFFAYRRCRIPMCLEKASIVF